MMLKTTNPEKAERLNTPPPPQTVTVRIHAGQNLNLDSDGRPHSTIIRIYKLKDPNAFLQTTYDILSDQAKEKEALGKDILESREVLLIPGQHYEATEKILPDAPYIAVAALFRTPAPQRWRFVFDNAGNAASGLILGVHACALTVSRGVPHDSSVTAPAELGSLQCP